MSFTVDPAETLEFFITLQVILKAVLRSSAEEIVNQRNKFGPSKKECLGLKLTQKKALLNTHFAF